MFNKKEFIQALQDKKLDDAKSQINLLQDANNYFIQESSLIHVAIDFNFPELVEYLIKEKNASLYSPNNSRDMPLTAALKSHDTDTKILDILLKNMNSSDIKAQYLEVEDTGTIGEEYVRNYIQTCRKLETSLRRAARGNITELAAVISELHNNHQLKQEYKMLAKDLATKEEGAVGKIIKNIVDAFRSMFGLDDLTKLVKKINNEPELRSKVENLEAKRDESQNRQPAQEK